MDPPEGNYQFFEPLSSAEYAALEADIAARGVLVPIERDEQGNILDGHHRAEIAERLDKPCPSVTRTFATEEEKEAHVYLMNLARRHLSPEQMAEVLKRLRERTEVAREVARQMREQGKTQAEVAAILGVAQQTLSDWESSITGSGIALHDCRMSVPRAYYEEIAGRLTEGHSAAQVASDYHITRQRVYQIAELVRARDERQPHNLGGVALPEGKYRCIVIDPPWPMEKIEREERPAQGPKLDYPVMSLEEIAALPIGDLAIAEGCHVYLWVTHKFLPAGLDLFKAWGVNYQCEMTWVKPVGFTPFSWMYNTEHVLFGRIGSLGLDRMGLKLSFESPVTVHSAKPDVFYQRVLAASPGPRLEMFARSEREGFNVWGNEVQQQAA